MYRNELKYIIDSNTAIVIRSKMEQLLSFDYNADDEGFYKVTSLYFDDYSNSALNDNIIGQILRKKFRIRIYNHSEKFIRLEKKVKHNRGCMKTSYTLNLKQYEMIMNSDYEALKQSTENKLVQEFCLDGIHRKLRPKVIVDYNRQTFVYKFGAVRITFDYDVKHSLGNTDLFSKEKIYVSAVNGNQIIMEVKYTGFLPSHIKSFIQQGISTRQSISKYTICRTHAII